MLILVDFTAIMILYNSCIVDVSYKSRHWNLVIYLRDNYTITCIILQGYIGTML